MPSCRIRFRIFFLIESEQRPNIFNSRQQQDENASGCPNNKHRF
jgi:hypothetical protein